MAWTRWLNKTVVIYEWERLVVIQTSGITMTFYLSGGHWTKTTSTIHEAYSQSQRPQMWVTFQTRSADTLGPSSCPADLGTGARWGGCSSHSPPPPPAPGGSPACSRRHSSNLRWRARPQRPGTILGSAASSWRRSGGGSPPPSCPRWPSFVWSVPCLRFRGNGCDPEQAPRQCAVSTEAWSFQWDSHGRCLCRTPCFSHTEVEIRENLTTVPCPGESHFHFRFLLKHPIIELATRGQCFFP